MRKMLLASALVLLARPTAARADDACGSPDLIPACTKYHDTYWDVCKKSDFDANNAQAIKDWAARVGQLDAVTAELKKFQDKYGECFWQTNGCKFDKQELGACMGAPEAYKQRWQEEIDWTIKTTLGQSLTRAGKMKKQKNELGYREAVNDLKRALATAEERLKLNETAAIHVDPAALQAKIAEAKGIAGETQGELKATMASVRCPAAKWENPSLLSKLKGLAEETRQAQTKGRMTVTTLSFHFISKPWQEAVPLIRQTNEYVSTGACEKQVKEGETKCRVMEMKFRRSKAGNGPWSDWVLDATGGGDELLCENAGK